MNPDRSKLVIWIDIISKVFTILIPIVLFYFGMKFQQSQDADHKEQQNYNRITTLLKSLSSDNIIERKLAVKFSQDLARDGNFPTELLSVINEISTTDTTNSKDAQSVLKIVNQKAITDKNTIVEKMIQNVVDNSPTKVYMQVPRGYNMHTARQLFTVLKSQGYNILGIERVDIDKIPSVNELRYFRDADKAKAIRLSEKIINLGTDITVKFLPGHENLGSQLEIWLK